MAVKSRCSTKSGDGKKGGDTSCGGDEGNEIKKGKELRKKSREQGKYLVTKEVYKNKATTPASKGTVGKETITTDAIVEEKNPESKGLVSYTKDEKKEYEGSKGGSQESKVSETKYFKRKGVIGRALGKDYRQKGGKTETEENGKLTTVYYKGKGRAGRVKEETDKKITETDKKQYDKAVADIKDMETSKKSDWHISGQKLALGNLNYAKAKVKETKDDGGEVTAYKLGTPYSSKKDIRVGKKTYKKDVINPRKEGTVKLRKAALKASLKKGNYGKA